MACTFRGAGSPLVLLVVHLSSTFQRAAEKGFAADFGSVSGDGHSSRCCTVGELLQDWDSVSVIAVQEKCDDKGLGAAAGPLLEKRETGRTRPPSGGVRTFVLRARRPRWNPAGGKTSLSRGHPSVTLPTIRSFKKHRLRNLEKRIRRDGSI